MNLSCSLAYKIKMEKCHVVNVEHNAFVRQFREPEREREIERKKRERTKFNKKSQREKSFPYDTRQYPVWRPPVMNAAAGKGEQTPPPPPPRCL